MKRKGAILIACVLILCAAGASLLFGRRSDFSFTGTTFYYDGQSYDVTSCVEAINSITSAIPVGDKIVVECHAGPKNQVYCIFDTGSRAFESNITGTNLTWRGDDLSTAVYSFWSDIYSFDGTVIKSYDLAEDEFISDLTFSDDNSKLTVTIESDSSPEQIDMIDL